MRKEEIFISIEKIFKKMEQFIKISIYNNQVILVLSINRKRKRQSICQYVIIKSVAIHYLINVILIYILMMKRDI